jgi:CDP-diacylglycerol---glycerol-3-phosphate 3-phosphatidyltransferase
MPHAGARVLASRFDVVAKLATIDSAKFSYPQQSYTLNLSPAWRLHYHRSTVAICSDNEMLASLVCPQIALFHHFIPMNLPNSITLSRLLGLPVIIYCLYSTSLTIRWLGVGVFLVAALTDWLDGYLARKLDLVTDLGKFLDPLVDKLLVLMPLLILIDLHLVPAVGVCLILVRELTIAGWRVGQVQISGANIWGKLKTTSQIVAIAMLMAPRSLTSHTWLVDNWHLYGLVAFWISVGLTLISGILYLIPPTTDAQQQV